LLLVEVDWPTSDKDTLLMDLDREVKSMSLFVMTKGEQVTIGKNILG
jgi:hypothetical protein